MVRMTEKLFKRFKQKSFDGTLIIIQTGSLETHDVKVYNIDDIVDLLNKQHEKIEYLQKQLSHLEYRFFEYRNKIKSLPKDEVEETLQKHYRLCLPHDDYRKELLK